MKKNIKKEEHILKKINLRNVKCKKRNLKIDIDKGEEDQEFFSLNELVSKMDAANQRGTVVSCFA